MKSYCKGLEITRDMVAEAYATWASKESGRKNGYRVTQEYGDPDALVDEIHAEIVSRALRLRPIRRYRHVEPTNGKVRTIGIESVKQQVCDYTAVLALTPLLDAKIGFYQTASVEGKGQRLCRAALRRWSHTARYHVKADVRQCYPSIGHEVVMRILRRYVRSDDVLYLCERLLATYDLGGLEIGSYFSLKMALLVLSFPYHHIESLGKRRRGAWKPLATHQLWHMDDFILVGNSKSDLTRAMRSLERYLGDELGLSLKAWKVCKTSPSEPLDLGGWVVRERGGRTVTTLRSGIFLRATRAFRRFGRHPSVKRARSCASYWGWIRRGDCDGAIRKRNIDGTFARARRLVSAYERRYAEWLAQQASLGSMP